MKLSDFKPLLVSILFFFLVSAGSVNAAWIGIFENYTDNMPMADMMLSGEDETGGEISESYSSGSDPMFESFPGVAELYTPYDDGMMPTMTTVRQIESNSWGSDFTTITMRGVDEFNPPYDPYPLYNGIIDMWSSGGSMAEYEFRINSEYGKTGPIEVTLNFYDDMLPWSGLFEFNFSIVDSNSNSIFSVSSFDNMGEFTEILSLNFAETYYLYAGFMMDSFWSIEYIEGVPHIFGMPATEFWELYYMDELYVELDIAVGEESPVPIPSAGILLFTGLLGFTGYRRKL